MFPKINPKQMKKMMRQMGMETKELDVREVVIKLDDSEIRIQAPDVSIVEMQGQKTYQISGGTEEVAESGSNMSDADVKLVVSQTGVSSEEAKKALEGAEGDIASAIMSLTKE